MVVIMSTLAQVADGWFSQLQLCLMTALSTMVNLELPHVNIMSKLDLLSKKDKKQLDRWG